MKTLPKNYSILRHLVTDKEFYKLNIPHCYQLRKNIIDIEKVVLACVCNSVQNDFSQSSQVEISQGLCPRRKLMERGRWY